MTKEINVYQRLAKVMEEVAYIQKEKKSGMSYSVVSHDAVTAKVRPALLKHGVVYFPVRCEHTQNGDRAECSMTVRFVNIDTPTDFFDVPTFGYGIDKQDKGPGKAMSYAVKYALLKALGLETGDDPDYDNVDHEPSTNQSKKKDANTDQAAAAAYMSMAREYIPLCENETDLRDWWKSEGTNRTKASLTKADVDALKALCAEQIEKMKETA